MEQPELAPLEACVPEYLVDAFRLRGELDGGGSGHDHRRNDGFPPFQYGRRRAQILNPAIGAGADEDPVDVNVRQSSARFQPHVTQCVGDHVATCGIGLGAGVGYKTTDRQGVFRTRAPCHHGLDRGSIKLDFAVEDRARVAGQCPPIGKRVFPIRFRRSKWPAVQVFEGGIVRRDHAAACRSFDRHIANRQSLFDRHRTNGRSGIFDCVAAGAPGSDLADDRKDHVFRVYSGRQRTVNRDPHGLWANLPQCLRRHDMGVLGLADAESDRAQRALGRRVTVAADDRQSWQRDSLLGSDDMNDALPRIAEAKAPDPAPIHVLVELADHAGNFRRRGICDAAARCGDVMVRRAEKLARVANRQATTLHVREGVEGTLVDDVAIDIDEGRTGRPRDDHVTIPNLVEHRARVRSCRCIRVGDHHALPALPDGSLLLAKRLQDLRARRGPYGVVAEDVFENLAEVADPIRDA